jgi:hypothetical protein
MNYFDKETNEELYKVEVGFAAFKRLRNCDLSDWTEENKGFLSAMMKNAFYDGLEVVRNEVLDAVDKLSDKVSSLRHCVEVLMDKEDDLTV